MNALVKTFLRGLATVLPLVITVYVCWWLLSSSEKIFEDAITYVLPDKYYVNGSGIVAVVLLTFFIGLIMKVSLLSKVFDMFERMIMSFPLVKTIYGGIKDFFEFFSEDNKDSFSKAVFVRMGDSDERLLGLITSQTPEDFLGKNSEGLVAVYLPMSYQIGGFTVFVPKDRIEEVDPTVTDTLRYILTAGVSSSGKKIAQT